VTPGFELGMNAAGRTGKYRIDEIVNTVPGALQSDGVSRVEAAPA
jgi:hypothetical protein